MHGPTENDWSQSRTLMSETILATGSPLKMMKNAFYFTSKDLSALNIFKFLSWLFGHVSKPFE